MRSRGPGPPEKRRAPGARLRDCLGVRPRALFVGINPGIRSAETGHHFAGPSNRFWKLLHESGLVPEPLTFERDRELPRYGFGITNLVSRATPGIGDLRPEELEASRARLLNKIARTRPEVVVLVGVTLSRLLPPPARGRKGRIPLGAQKAKLSGARVFLLPNPSGRNANYPYSEMLAAFRSLRRFLAGRRGAKRDGGGRLSAGGRPDRRPGRKRTS